LGQGRTKPSPPIPTIICNDNLIFLVYFFDDNRNESNEIDESDNGDNGEENEEDNEGDNDEDIEEDNDDGDGETTFLRTRVMKTMGMTMRTMRMATGNTTTLSPSRIPRYLCW